MNIHGSIERLALAGALGTALALSSGCIIVTGDRGWSEHSWDEHDRPSRPWIGVYSDSVPGSTASQLGIDRNNSTLITSIIGGTPAERAGLRRFDVIVAVNGDDDASEREFRRAIRGTPDGDPLTLTVLREGQRLDIAVTPEPRNRSRHDGWND
ncbi:MAG TPA: hypothetical protein DEB06_08715 [Phycisphaerales bacterium]|nr:hypothetical protein [Phycisphaerales bacterium]